MINDNGLVSKMKVDDLILTKSLGKGAFGEVFLTIKENNPYEIFATKRIDRAVSDKPENFKRLLNEVSILKVINHPNIVKLIESKKTRSHYYLVTEFCNGGSLSGCLRQYIKLYKRLFTEDIIQYLMKQIVSAIYYLHKNKILHRDLKLDNILVNFKNDEDKNSLNMMKAEVKLIDFGFATKLHSSQSNLTHTVLGTPCNMDPQLLKNMEEHTRNVQGYDSKVDIWSLGTLCYELLTGKAIFIGKDLNDFYKKVKEGIYFLPLSSSKEIVSFINGMLQEKPECRYSAEDLMKHDFLTKNPKEFHPIDRNKVYQFISGNNLCINVKNNNYIWSIFNQKKPNVIMKNELMPIPEMDESNKGKAKVIKIHHHNYNNQQIPKIQNINNNIPIDKRNNQNIKLYQNNQNYQGGNVQQRQIRNNLNINAQIHKDNSQKAIRNNQEQQKYQHCNTLPGKK